MPHSSYKRLFLGYIAFYLLLSLAGGGLLSIPALQVHRLSFFEVLFSSVSLTSLCGLQVVSLATAFNHAGHWIALLLIQLSAVGHIGFMLYFSAMAFPKLRGALGLESDKSLLWTITRRLLLYFLILEGVSVVGVYAFLGRSMAAQPLSEALFYSFFHGISVFCHSGFSLYVHNLSQEGVSTLFLLQLALIAIMGLGSLGYPATYDLFSLRRLRARMRDPETNWLLSTRAVLYFTAAVLIIGAVLFLFINATGFLSHEKAVEASITALFNVAGARGAGFYSIAPASFGTGMMLVYMLLMLAGIGFASVRGGYRLDDTLLVRQARPVLRTYASGFIVFIVLILLTASLLWIGYSNLSYLSVLFDVTSAYTNTGLSAGALQSMSPIGQFVMMLAMIAGRFTRPLLLYIVARQSASKTTY